MQHQPGSRPIFAGRTVRILLLLGLVFGLGCARAAASPLANAQAAEPCPDNSAITNANVSAVSATSAALSWDTAAPATTCLSLDSSLLPAADTPAPEGQFRGIAYGPGAYLSDLAWVADPQNVIKADVAAAAKANFNILVLYPVGSATGIHDFDRSVFEQAAASGMKIAFRLEWTPNPFNWARADCDQVVNYYKPYLQYFKDHPTLLQYLLLNNPLDAVTDPDSTDNIPLYAYYPSSQKQRDYVSYCYTAIKKLAPNAPVYANSYYGWRDELPQAPYSDLVDGLSLAIYSQHNAGAPYDCGGIPAAGDSLSHLICKDQFDYYLERSSQDNFSLPNGKKPLVLDSTGFAPAASYDNQTQGNGVVADSAAKVEAIQALRRYVEGHAEIAGWSYFMLLHKPEADWGLIDRRRLDEKTATITHQRTLTDLLPGQSYTVTLRAGSQTQEVKFITPPLPAKQNAPFLTITKPGGGTGAYPPGSSLKIAWATQDFPGAGAALQLFYDTQDHGCDQKHPIGNPIALSAPDGEITWTVPQMTGLFYIYGILDDQVHAPICDYSPGGFVVSNLTQSAMLNVRDEGQNITLDGKLDEPIWRSPYVRPLLYADHVSQPDRTQATVSMVWDNRYLYLGFRVTDQHVEVADDKNPWDDDSVSALFFNGQMNCRVEVDGGGAGKCDRAVALLPGTTLNLDTDTDTGYTAEMRIPWAELHTTPVLLKLLPADFYSVDHDGAPGKFHADTPYFSKFSWDGDASVDTTGRGVVLGDHEHVFLSISRR